MPGHSNLLPYLEQIEEWRRGGLFHREISEKLKELGLKTSRKSVQHFCQKREIELGPVSERRLVYDQPGQGSASPSEVTKRPSSASDAYRLRKKEEEKAKKKAKAPKIDPDEIDAMMEEERLERKRRAGGD